MPYSRGKSAVGRAESDRNGANAVGWDRRLRMERRRFVPFGGRELQLVINNILARHHCWLDVILINRSIEAVYLV